MSKNLKINEVVYSSITSIDIPTEEDGVATFVDTSDADATAADIASGKTAYVNGEIVTGEAEAGSGVEYEEISVAGGENEVYYSLPRLTTVVGGLTGGRGSGDITGLYNKKGWTGTINSSTGVLYTYAISYTDGVMKAASSKDFAKMQIVFVNDPNQTAL